MNEKVGVWRAIARLGGYTVRELLWPELTCGAILGVGGGVAIVNTTHLAGRGSLVSEVLPLAAALLAVVFAALALVVSIPSQDYMRAMAETSGGGLIRFLDPFLIAVGTQTSLLLMTFAYQAEANHVTAAVEHAAFYLISFLLAFGLLDVVALARSLVRHGINRGVEATTISHCVPDAAPVHRLDERRNS